jgi:hypothetical protein
VINLSDKTNLYRVNRDVFPDINRKFERHVIVPENHISGMAESNVKNFSRVGMEGMIQLVIYLIRQKINGVTLS